MLLITGLCPVTPKRLVSESIEWAKLENARPTTVADYIDALPQEENTEDCCKHTYLFDWSLPQYAPQLVKEVTIPRYFAGQ